MNKDSEEGGSSLIDSDLRAFFADLLVTAADEKKWSISPLAIHYVAEMLVRFNETALLFSQKGVSMPVLSDMLSEALEADFYRRVSILRQLGDTSLMVSGYFPEALERRNVNRSFYHQMGETAYSHLSEISERSNVYIELSEQFSLLVNLINEAAFQLKTEGLGANELLEFYDNTKSNTVLKKLNEQGVFPLKSDED